MIQTSITPFQRQIKSPLTKNSISVLQINLGKRCNLACSHCHVEAGPRRTEELTPEICEQLIELIRRFPQIKTVDLTGGAPEMNYGFKPLVEVAKSLNKQVIVRSNLTIYFVKGFEDIPAYCSHHQTRIIASLPCYLQDNVDRMRGSGVYQDSIAAIQKLNQLGYGHAPDLILDLVYNPALPTSDSFSLPPHQENLQQAYKVYLREKFDIEFNQLLTITNLPIGRTKLFLQRQKLHDKYLEFLADNYNPDTVENLMCRNELSIDYLGNVYDCDFNQMENRPARTPDGENITVKTLLEADSLDIIETVHTEAYCYGCTAGCGSSCGGALT
ncbi:MAG: arsenosugar biosynthesis radical SAM protein ArsS [Arthrospira sp. SH-MAG29]|nr:arsenosugar biosynthesis radical SAM (seleno)protein ArsS [Arthrospira sp. SH-MAG29]MBS0016875.1 arsenosugar biosynthesis radical SAM protein ArsS [Arthrospira sp. SH-MAG29]